MQIKKLLTIAALSALPIISEAKTLEDLLVEKGVITKSEVAGTAGTKTSNGGRVYYNEGTRIEFPDAGFALRINTLIQTRYAFTDNSEDGRNRINNSSFDVNTARLFVHGAALHNEFRYMLEADFAGHSNTSRYGNAYDGSITGADAANASGAQLNDAYIVWSPCEGWDTQMGQFRTFISRQYNVTNPGFAQFADDSVVSDHFNLGRQAGIAQHVDLADGMVKVGAGVWNGVSQFGGLKEGVNRPGIDTDHSVGGYVRVNPTGKMDVYQEGDVDNTEELATSVGVAYIYNEAHNGERNFRLIDTESHNVSADVNAKIAGFSLHGEYFHKNEGLQNLPGDDVKTNGGYAQVGYFILPGELEVAGRYSILDCDDGAASGICQGNDKINEAAGTINYYWWKHQMKAQLGYYLVNEDSIASVGGENDFNTNRWVFQLSGYF